MEQKRLEELYPCLNSYCPSATAAGSLPSNPDGCSSLGSLGPRGIREEQGGGGKAHPGSEGFCQLFPSPHRRRRVLGLGVPRQKWRRREHASGAGLDRKERRQYRRRRTDRLGRDRHSPIEVSWGVISPGCDLRPARNPATPFAVKPSGAGEGGRQSECWARRARGVGNTSASGLISSD
jgi:hypothetical protein